MTGRHHRLPFRSILVAAASLLLLGAWTPSPDWASISREASTIRAACERQHKTGLLPSIFATEHCANTRIAQLYAREGYPLLDILNAYLAQRDAIAAKVDQGIIAPERAYTDLAQARDTQNAALRRSGADPVLFDPGVFSWAPFACLKQGFVDQLCN